MTRRFHLNRVVQKRSIQPWDGGRVGGILGVALYYNGAQIILKISKIHQRVHDKYEKPSQLKPYIVI